jgi:hypothetical protein
MKGFSYDDPSKPLVKVAYLDGYLFGERMLEGVVFKFEITPHGKMKASFLNPNGIYEQGLNQKKWLKDALAFAKEHDIFDDSPTLDGEQVLLIFENDKHQRVNFFLNANFVQTL